MKAPADELVALADEISGCRKCPRLVRWREEVGVRRRASFKDEEYWARPVPGFGDPDASILIVGLAPAAHGGNRTGRMFTGDRSGDWLWAALWRAGLATQPTSVSRDDGLCAKGVYVAAAVRCAPPQNRPTPIERDTCLPYLRREVQLLGKLSVVVALGSFGYDAALRVLGAPTPKVKFGHLVESQTSVGLPIVCSYHPSQQNTFTGKLTTEMFDAVFRRALQLAVTGVEREAPTSDQ